MHTFSKVATKGKDFIDQARFGPVLIIKVFFQHCNQGSANNSAISTGCNGLGLFRCAYAKADDDRQVSVAFDPRYCLFHSVSFWCCSAGYTGNGDVIYKA